MTASKTLGVDRTYTVELTYFKPNGKYYSGGSFAFRGEEKTSFLTIMGHIRHRHLTNNLPGVHHASQFIVLVGVPTHPHDHPTLILPETS